MFYMTLNAYQFKSISISISIFIIFSISYDLFVHYRLIDHKFVAKIKYSYLNETKPHYKQYLNLNHRIAKLPKHN